MWLTLFIMSFMINVFAVFYLRWLLQSMKIMAEDMSNLTDSVAGFATHIKSVYDLEMFYGDETLKALFQHASTLVEQLESVDFLLEEDFSDDPEETEEDPDVRIIQD